MARPLRIDIEDGLYHVISRGWERRKIVDDDTDREKWLQLFGRVAERYDWRCFAWVLMDGSVPKIVEMKDGLPLG